MLCKIELYKELTAMFASALETLTNNLEEMEAATDELRKLIDEAQTERPQPQNEVVNLAENLFGRRV